MTLKLALKNLLGTGLRFAINSVVIAISFMVIVFANGLLDGLSRSMLDTVTRTEISKGRIENREFDTLDPLTYDLHITADEKTEEEISKSNLAPFLYHPGTVYANHLSYRINLKGILPEQKILEIPLKELSEKSDLIPVALGSRMAKRLKLEEGDTFVVKWRDSKGAFDAVDVRLKKIFSTNNPTVDNGILWIDIKDLQKMTLLENKYSTLISGSSEVINDFKRSHGSKWKVRSRHELTSNIRKFIKDKKMGQRMIFALLFLLSCIGIFNAQILSVFKRKKEIGLLMALGMKKIEILRIFCLEGIITCLSGLFIGTAIGIPFFYWTSVNGIPVDHAKGSGMPIGDKIFPYFHHDSFIMIMLIMLTIITIASFIPSKKILKFEPAKALSGRK